jgi:hypothetical protein
VVLVEVKTLGHQEIPWLANKWSNPDLVQVQSCTILVLSHGDIIASGKTQDPILYVPEPLSPYDYLLSIEGWVYWEPLIDVFIEHCIDRCYLQKDRHSFIKCTWLVNLSFSVPGEQSVPVGKKFEWGQSHSHRGWLFRAQMFTGHRRFCSFHSTVSSSCRRSRTSRMD